VKLVHLINKIRYRKQNIRNLIEKNSNSYINHKYFATRLGIDVHWNMNIGKDGIYMLINELKYKIYYEIIIFNK
jgi:hypothetical protein